jgi:hypothetical protein
MRMVPSTLPVGPVYGGKWAGLMYASTLAAGIGVTFIGLLGGGAA